MNTYTPMFTPLYSSAAYEVYKRQVCVCVCGTHIGRAEKQPQHALLTSHTSTHRTHIPTHILPRRQGCWCERCRCIESCMDVSSIHI